MSLSILPECGRMRWIKVAWLLSPVLATLKPEVGIATRANYADADIYNDSESIKMVSSRIGKSASSTS